MGGERRHATVRSSRWAVLVGLLIGSVLPLAPLRGGEENLRLPHWFWRPPDRPGVGVGCARPGNYAETTFGAAFEDAAQRLWRDRRSRIVTERYALVDANSTFIFNAPLKVRVDTAGFAAFSASLVRVDSARSEQLAVMLVATEPVDVSTAIVPAPPPPDFEAIDDPANYTHIQITPEYFTEISSWREAEKEARTQLAFQARTILTRDVITLNKLVSGSMRRSVDVILSDVRTIARGIDTATSARVVAVRVARSGVKVPDYPLHVQDSLDAAHRATLDSLETTEEARLDTFQRQEEAKVDSLRGRQEAGVDSVQARQPDP
jgi:hypothetical protein